MTPEAIKALSAAQTEMGKPIKDTKNPHFRTMYADLSSVRDACVPTLNKHGFAVIQVNGTDELGEYVKTIFAHESGGIFETPVRLRIGKDDMQGYGSAMTYARRYGLMSLAGLAPEDDDGNAAVQGANAVNPQKFGDRFYREADPKPEPKPDITPEASAIGWLQDSKTGEELEARWAKLSADRPVVAWNLQVVSAMNAARQKFAPELGADKIPY